jgi:hypothetical protein
LKIKKNSKKVRKISKQISKHAGTKYGIINPLGLQATRPVYR